MVSWSNNLSLGTKMYILVYTIFSIFMWKLLTIYSQYNLCSHFLQVCVDHQMNVSTETDCFIVWGDMKIVTTWLIVCCLHRYYVQCTADAGGSFLQTNTEYCPNYLLLFQKCCRNFQPRLTYFFHNICSSILYLFNWECFIFNNFLSTIMVSWSRNLTCPHDLRKFVQLIKHICE